jgi:hypothetical protein
MAIVLTQQASVLEGNSTVGTQPASVELHDDRFVLKTYGWTTPAVPTTVIDAPLSALRVTGSMATLTFTVGDLSHSVDYSFGTGASLMSTDSLLFRSAGILKKSGIYDMLTALRARGVPVKYRSLRQIMLWGALATAVILVIIGIYVVDTMDFSSYN